MALRIVIILRAIIYASMLLSLITTGYKARMLRK